MRPDFSGGDRFQVLGCLGSGGMGVVYQAIDRERNARVALKTLHRLTGDAIFRFKNEFRALQDLGHPNLVELLELIEQEGQWLITMELIDGVSFLRYVRGEGDWDDGSGRPPAALSAPFVAAPAVPRGSGQAETVSGSAETIPGWRGPEGGAPPRFDEERLRGALGQLARGLNALHEGGKVHRDIKPSNILVTREGRVVLLDFGFVLATEGEDPVSSSEVVGTVDYMAPEQAAQKMVGPAADWYSVGVLLYEALTGRVPYEGRYLEVLVAKQREKAPAPRDLAPDVPPDLDQLCRELLSIDPARRPSGREVLERVGVRGEGDDHAARAPGLVAPFVGREAELGELREAYRWQGAPEPRVVVLEGESGVGKTALTRRFTDELRGGVVLLKGRCYERESVPYKAFDGVVDALSRYLMRLSKLEAAQLLPRHVTLLAEIFPVLRRVESVAQAIRPQQQRKLEPQELRAQLFAALRELFQRMSDRARVVIVIDDLQWADIDSMALLRELLRPPDAPPLFLLATRRVGRSDEATLEPRPQLPSGARRIEVGRLPPADARELAVQLLRRLGSAPGGAGEAGAEGAARTAAVTPEAIAEEAGGHPLFIDELLRHARAGAQAPTQVRLDDALWARVAGLDSASRAVLEVVVVAGAPVPQDLIARSVNMTFSPFLHLVSALRAANLVRTAGARRSDPIDSFHDRVREAVWSRLGGDTRRRWHERLALAFEAAQVDRPEALATHWRGAGERDKALHYTTAAAEQAIQALAFERAARLYRTALELAPPQGAEHARLQAALGDALAKAGRGAESANAYLAAVHGTTGERAIELNTLAAEQFLRSGHIDSGLEILRVALAGVGLEMPATPRKALLSLLMRRATVRLRGLGFRERAAADIPARDLGKIDLCWAVAVGLAIIDTIRGADFQARHLLLALRSGEPYRVARALAMEVGYLSTAGGPGRKRTAKVLDEAERLARRLDHPHAIGLTHLMAGAAGVLEGRWADSLGRFDSAIEVLRTQCVGVAWELASARALALWALYYLGELGQIADRATPLLAEAQERGDLYTATNLLTFFMPLLQLAADQPALARETSTEALARWSQQGFHFQHYFALFARVLVDLYEGRGAEAWQRATAEWPALKGSLLLEVQQNRLEALHVRGRAALAATRAEDLSPLADAQAMARKITRENEAWATPLGWLLEAGIASHRGDPVTAAARLAAAADGLRAADMALFAAAARYQLGVLLGGDEGGALTAAADAWLRGQGVVSPPRMVAMLVPGRFSQS